MANTRKKTAEDESNIALLRATNQMLETTKKEAELRGKSKSVKQIENARQETIKQFEQELGEDASKYIKHEPIKEEEQSDNDIFAILAEHQRQDEMAQAEKDDKLFPMEEMIEKNNDVSEDDINYETSDDKAELTFDSSSESDAQYDIIPLPSNGECYKNKKARIPVAYMTAYDENLITSPNLYRDGLVIDLLIKNKVIDKDFNVDDLVSGDADAITLFLRATSYGTDYPVTVTDPESGKNFSTTIDLSTIKIKDFKLKGDENGYFDFTLPKSKKLVKFRYLTRKDEQNLKKLNELENNQLMANNLDIAHNTINAALKADNTLDANDKAKFGQFNDALKKWANKIRDKKNVQFNKIITNRMEMQIVSIDGETSRKKISEMVKNMAAIDALKLRRYIADNEPGVDFSIEVQKPESLGGGSLKTFLEWDDAVFLNIA